MADDILVDDDGAVRTITLNRPHKKNSLTLAAWDALAGALADARSDPTVGCVILTGAGDAFCAGTDVGEMADPSTFDGVDMDARGYAAVMSVLEEFDVPLVAAVNGVGVGFGLTVLPLCDLVLIARSARLRAPFVSLGVTIEGAGSYLLPDRIGWQETARLVFTGEWLEADDAVRIGLAWQAVPDATLMQEARALAHRIAAGSVESLRTSKRLMMAARGDAVAAARRRETAEFTRLLSDRLGSSQE